MLAKIEGNRVLSVRGDASNPMTQGFLCRKTAHYEQMIHHPDRILYPMKRVGEKGSGDFIRISWEEAAETIAGRWKEIIASFGAEAILPYSYAGTEGKIQGKCGEAFFHYMGASKLKRTICSSGKGAGWNSVMGKSLAMPVFRLAESDRILVWSSNVAATRTHEIPFLQKARSQGARITLIEVYQSPAAAYCDDVVLVRPGTDAALALAMIHVLEQEGLTDHAYLEEYVSGYDRLLAKLPDYTPAWAETITGLPAGVIRELALSYGRAERPSILLGSGVSRQANGAMSVRCITALPAVIGSRKQGFGLCGVSQVGPWGDLNRVTRPDFDTHHARTLNMMQLASALDPARTDPPVKSLYVYCSNPLNVTANQEGVRQGLLREDLFTVVHERFLTDTALYADILLPAVFSLESCDVFTAYGYNGIQYGKKLLDPPGECKSDWDTFALLARAMGFSDPYFTLTEEEKCLEYLDRGCGQLKNLSQEMWERLLDGEPIVQDPPGLDEIRTRSGKIELFDETAATPLIAYVPLKGEGSPEYPLHLVAAPSVYTLNSTFTSEEKLTGARGPMALRISPADAGARAIQDGDPILCCNALAETAFLAKVDPGVLPGTVVAEGVYRMRDSLNGHTVNALFSEELSDLGEATTMNGNFVEVRKM